MAVGTYPHFFAGRVGQDFDASETIEENGAERYARSSEVKLKRKIKVE
jgi:hypothetical protein